MVKAIIFDLYGTLLKLSRAPSVYFSLMRDAAGPDLRCAIKTAMVCDSKTLADLYQHIGGSVPPNVAELEAELDREIDAVDLYPDVLPALRALSDADIQIGAISNLATSFKKAFFAHSLESFVHAPVFSCDCGLVKPDPSIYQLALDHLGVSAADAIMVGDSPKCDVDGPSAIGITGIHLDRSGGSGSQRAINSLDEIIQTL